MVQRRHCVEHVGWTSRRAVAIDHAKRRRQRHAVSGTVRSPTGYRFTSTHQLLLAVRQGSKPKAETLLSG
jgi:hypothetical protein